MHWYGGSIAEAVSLSKQKNAIFVVFVEGDNDLSVEMAGTLEDDAVLKRLSDQNKFLAIKLKSGSVNYTHFAQIYQFVPVPSLFFIGRNGTPLEVVCAGVQPDNLAIRIDRILDEHNKGRTFSAQPSTSSQSVKEQTASLLQSESAANAATSAVNTPPPAVVVPATVNRDATAAPGQAPSTAESAEISNIPAESKSTVTTVESSQDYQTDLQSPALKVQKVDTNVDKSGQQYEVECVGDVCVRRPKTGDPGPSTRQASQLDDSKTGVETPETSSAQPANSDVKVEQAKELIEIRRREKAEKEKELEKQKEKERRMTGQGVTELKRWQQEQELKQIQEERKREKMENNLARQRILDQIAQDRAERKAREGQAQPAPAQSTPVAAQPAPTSGDGGSRARLQFKLPDGETHTAHFDSDDTLAVVQRYVADYLQMSTDSFSLWTAFPRQELCDGGATLRGLLLAPSAALLVLPRRVAPTVAQPSVMSKVISIFTSIITALVLNPSQQIVNWIRGFLNRPPPPPSQSPPGNGPPAPRTAPGVRRRGNIHRLPGDSAADDDNNTWNGNSTQQM